MTEQVGTHARTFGTGPRTALALHCTFGHAGAWKALGQALSVDLTLTALDLPGHGRSADWDGRTDLQAACVSAALPYLRTRTDVIGHSFGATVALRLAVEHPDTVRSLTLIEPVFFAAAKADSPAAFDAYEREAAPFVQALAQGDSVRAARAFGGIWGDGRPWEALPESMQIYMADRIGMIPAQATSIIDDAAGLLVPGRMAAIKAPVLLIEGDQSPCIIGAINAALAVRLGTVRRVTVAGAGHMVPVTHAAEVARHVRAVLEMTEE